MRGHRTLLGLVIVMGVLILAGTAALIGVVVHRLAAGHAAAATVAASTTAVPAPGGVGDATLFEPAGTKIQSMVRQSDTLLAIALTGGGPDRVLLWDLAGNRLVSELRLAP